MRTDERELLRGLSVELRVALSMVPKPARGDLMRLAVFLLAARSYTRPDAPDESALAGLKREWDGYKALPMAQLLAEAGDSLNARAAKYICRLKIAHQFDESWIEAYLRAVESGLDPRKCATMEETLLYTYGVSETIGMMIAKVLGVPSGGLRSASLQARALWCIHEIQTIGLSDRIGRRYFPDSELEQHGLEGLGSEYAHDHAEAFRAFIHAQLKLYSGWQRQASKGNDTIPRRYRPAVFTVLDACRSTAIRIEKNLW